MVTMTKEAICTLYDVTGAVPSPDFCIAPGIVFHTSSTHDGNLSDELPSCDPTANDGLACADAICNMRASEAGLTGTYAAWLSTSTVDAKDRVGNRPWVRTCSDGALVASDLADLTSGTLQSSIFCDENGNTESVTSVWTGTLKSGQARPLDHCADWTDASDAVVGARGFKGNTDSGWTNNTIRNCSNSFRLYCFQR